MKLPFRFGAARACALLLGLFLAGPAAASAQGILFVRVTGPSGAIADATVDVMQGGERLRRGGTDAKGQASFAALPAGVYEVRVDALGYKSHTRENVAVSTASSTVVDVALESSPIEMEGLTVQSQRIQIQRENTEFSTQVEERAIQLLPVTYQARDLVALTPGARPGHVWGGANFQANNYRIDGLSANHPGMGGDLIEPNINWIEKVEVRGLGAGAQYGGFQGGLIDIQTKRGSNDFRGMVRTTVENQALNTTNLVSSEIGTEVVDRQDLEGEIQGPLIRDKLFYYGSAKYIRENSHALNHLRQLEGQYSPALEKQTQEKLFGKLSWTPRPGSDLELSAAYLGTTADNYGITGYEAPGSAQRFTAPTWLVNAAYTQTLGEHGVLEARFNRFARNEEYLPYGGRDVPGQELFAIFPPYTAYANAPFTLQSNPTSTSGSVEASFQLHTGTLEHQIRVGAEYNRGGFINKRVRNGGMTWLPVNLSTYDPSDPSTWSHNSVSWIASRWGGEVHLDADVANAAAFVQSSLSLGPRVNLSPGVRWNQWTGWLTPVDGARFQAVQDQAVDPRIGISVDLLGDGSLVAKGHWGRYHQDLITQMFDRVAGADVFSNEEIWYYRGDPFTDPTTTFTQAERDALAAQGEFTRESVISLNETGPVDGYKQPYIEEWLVGLEKQFGRSVKLEMLYTRRKNKDMVALVDRNADTGYTRFRGVRVYDAGGQILPYQGGSVYLPEVYLPNYVLRDRLELCHADPDVCADLPPLPNLTYADVPNLVWDPDYRLTTAPGAKREFGQFQFTVEVARPTWGMSVSGVITDLKGNLDNVTGYTDPTTFDAGPYVRVNEGVNSYGTLENFADLEAKVSIWGNLFWDMLGGAFWTYRTGDHYSPQFRLSGLGLFKYKVGTGALNGAGTAFPGQELDYRLFWPLEGHMIYVGPRGLPEMHRRAIVDLHLERPFDVNGRQLSVILDVFNVLGDRAITGLQTMVNNGRDYNYAPDRATPWASTPNNMFFGAPLERTKPRTIRLGMQVGF
jgi:hypothetical protein